MKIKEPCVICGRIPSDRAHIKTRGSGGKNQEFNLIRLCREHHSEQHNIGFVSFSEKYPVIRMLLKLKGWRITDVFGVKKLERADGKSD